MAVRTSEYIRWKLEVYKMQYATHALVAKGRAIKMYMGPKGGKEELIALHDQAKALSDVLKEWNIEFGVPAEARQTPENEFHDDLVNGL
jgi:hypothetical protein